MQRKKYKVTFLFDKKNLWFENYLKKSNLGFSKKFIFKISKNHNKIKNQDIVFPLSYTKILSDDFLKKNKLILIIHCSKLPKDKGFAPLQYQILKNKKRIYISLIKAEKKVDSGPIILQNSFLLDGTELNNEIRHKQAVEMIKILKKFLSQYPKIKLKHQSGKSTFNIRRYPKDSELNINKSIKAQFNHLRINDNELYPSFFYYKGNKYILKIFKE